jgi:lipoprotein-releasing system ATP-binding protein
MTALLQAEGLVRDLGKEVKTRVLDHIDLAVNAGEYVALTGASGSGKSTLLYLLGVLDRPTEGRVFVHGQDVSDLDDDERADLRAKSLGFVFQFHFLLPELDVLENVAVPSWRRGDFSRREAMERAREVLGNLGLGDLIERRPSQLSGGQQQRVSIARALAGRPRIVLADEPTGNLDSKNGEIVVETFRELADKEGIAVVMVTHEKTFAARAHRQVALRDGRVVSDVRN